MAVLLGYPISGERILEGFYQRVRPFANAFMALFGGDRLPARSTPSLFLAALTAEPVEAQRKLFLADLLAHPLDKEVRLSGLWDRQGIQWVVFDVDGTREAARGRALPQTADRPAPQRRLRPLCDPGVAGVTRGEVVRNRTIVLQMHTHQWLGTFGDPGNGRVSGGIALRGGAIQLYGKGHDIPKERMLLHLDG